MVQFPLDGVDALVCHGAPFHDQAGVFLPREPGFQAPRHDRTSRDVLLGRPAFVEDSGNVLIAGLVNVIGKGKHDGRYFTHEPCNTASDFATRLVDSRVTRPRRIVAAHELGQGNRQKAPGCEAGRRCVRDFPTGALQSDERGVKPVTDQQL